MYKNVLVWYGLFFYFFSHLKFTDVTANFLILKYYIKKPQYAQNIK